MKIINEICQMGSLLVIKRITNTDWWNLDGLDQSDFKNKVNKSRGGDKEVEITKTFNNLSNYHEHFT